MKPRIKPYGTANACGRNIERLRMERGMKQYEVVKMMNDMGVSTNLSSYSKLEGQIRACNDMELYAISKILRVPMEELIEVQK